MSRLIAIEWDAREICVVVARTRGDGCAIEQAFSVATSSSSSDVAADKLDESVGEQLAKALAPLGKNRGDVLVALGRANIELRSFSVPPAPDDELPDMVRFQATKQFSTLGDNWPVDFVPLDRAADGAQNVLAAAIAPEVVAQIRRTCQTAGAEIKRLVLRPFAAASLWRRRTKDERCCLMVDILAEEADLTVLADGHAVLLRTVRLPADYSDEDLSRVLLGEIRRTMAAAHNQLGTRRIEQVVVCGAADDHAAFRDQVQQTLSLEVTWFDPFVGVELAPDLAANRPHRAGRFAPLLGMLLDEAAAQPHAIDFLNPRRRPEARSHRTRNLLAATAAALLLIAAFAWVRSQFKVLDDEIADLQQKARDVDAEIKLLDKNRRVTKEIDEFVAGDITWLDELRELSDRFPPANDAIVSQMSLHSQKDGGLMVLEGGVRKPDQLDALERAIRREGHHVTRGGSQRDDDAPIYEWKYRESMEIDAAAEMAARDAAAREVAAREAAKKSKSSGDAATGSSEKSASKNDASTSPRRSNGGGQ